MKKVFINTTLKAFTAKEEVLKLLGMELSVTIKDGFKDIIISRDDNEDIFVDLLDDDEPFGGEFEELK